MADCLNNEQQINSNLSESNVDALTSNLDVASSVTSEMGVESSISSTMYSTDATTSNLGSEEHIESRLSSTVGSGISKEELMELIPKYGNDIKLAEDNDGGLTDAIINTNIRIDNLESNSSFMPVGSIFASAIPQTDARVHLLDGSTISQNGIYETFANLIKTLVSDGNPISCTQAQFDADVTATGNCGKFVIDDVNGTIRLPKITTFIQGLSSITDIGKSLEAGLPSITHTHPQYITANSGAYMGRQDYSRDNSSSDIYPHVDTGTNSAVSSIYGKSDTVQPNATQYPYYIVLAGGYKSNEVVDFDNIMNEINAVKNKKNIETIWTGSILGGNTINVDLNGYEFGIAIMELYGSIEIAGIITKTSRTQFCWALNDKTTDNGVVSVRYSFTYNSTNKTMTVGTAFFPQIGSMVVENNVNFKLIAIMGVK